MDKTDRAYDAGWGNGLTSNVPVLPDWIIGDTAAVEAFMQGFFDALE